MNTVASTIVTGTWLVLAALVPASANAGEVQGNTIVVAHETPSVPAWRDQVSRDLSGQLRYPRAYGSAVQESGVVAVRFRCGDDGRPAEVTLARRSSSGMLNRAALAAISGLRSLHPLPDGLARGQTFQANVVFASSQSAYDRQVAWLRRAEAARLASKVRAEREVLALNLLVPPPG